ARTLRSVLGMSVIRSTLFEIRNAGDRFIFVGSGHGHGVGMSQWGAQAMAKRGASYRDILEWFFPGTRLVRSDAR
ncbi:MAG: stage II sporulation protein SpoIID, partial [Myxococcales bacterium]|nr:stage II sporulation protein SpoIID [Myxococcales bacterium]